MRDAVRTRRSLDRRRTRRSSRLVGHRRSARSLEDCAIPNPDHSIVQRLAERTSAPGNAHRGAKSARRFVHLLARARLTVDSDPNISDAQTLAARIAQVDTGHEQVRTAYARVRRRKSRGDAGPLLTRDDGELPFAALIRVAHEAAPGAHLRGGDGIHRRAVSALDPNLFESTQCRRPQVSAPDHDVLAAVSTWLDGTV